MVELLFLMEFYLYVSNHFMVLFISMLVLVSKKLVSRTESVDYAEDPLWKFVSVAQVLYKEYILV